MIKRTVKYKRVRKGSTSLRDKYIKDITIFLLSKQIPSVCEYKFHPTRKWKFDLAIPSLNIAIEYEGINSEKSRHTTITGYTGDCEKYNAAVTNGWRVLRYTAMNIKNSIIDLERLIEKPN